MVSSCLLVLSFTVNTGLITIPPMGKIRRSSLLCVRTFFSMWGSLLFFVVGFFVGLGFFVAVLSKSMPSNILLRYVKNGVV